MEASLEDSAVGAGHAGGWGAGGQGGGRGLRCTLARAPGVRLR